MGLFMQYAVAAADQAVVMAGLKNEDGQVDELNPQHSRRRLRLGLVGSPKLSKSHIDVAMRGSTGFHPVHSTLIK